MSSRVASDALILAICRRDKQFGAQRAWLQQTTCGACVSMTGLDRGSYLSIFILDETSGYQLHGNSCRIASLPIGSTLIDPWRLPSAYGLDYQASYLSGIEKIILAAL